MKSAACIGLLFATVLVAIRCTAAGGAVGLSPFADPNDRRPLGGVAPAWHHDHFQHLTWATLSARGIWLYDDPFTFDAHDAVLVNPLLGVLGRLSAKCGVEPLAALFWTSVVAAFFVPILAYLIARRCGCESGTSLLAAALAAFGSGLSGVLRSAEACGMPAFAASTVDRTFPDVQAFAGALAFPFVGICHALGMALVLWILSGERRQATVVESVALSFATAALGLSHPYEHLIVVSSYAGYCLVAVRSPNARYRWRLLLALVAGSTPVLGYHLWLRTLPVWSEVVGDSLALGRDRLDWIVGYGLLPAFAAVGGWKAVREGGPLRWFAGWAMGLYLLLAGFALPQSKICSLGHLPLGLLAAVGVVTLWNGLRGGFVRWMLAILVCPLLFASPAWFAADYLRGTGTRGDFDRWQAVVALQEDFPNARPRVLTDTATARIAVAFAAARVYAGNLYNTPRFFQKAVELRGLGVEPPYTDAPGVGAFPTPTDDFARTGLTTFLERHQFDAALLRADLPAARVLQRGYPAAERRQFGQWIYWRLSAVRTLRE